MAPRRAGRVFTARSGGYWGNVDAVARLTVAWEYPMAAAQSGLRPFACARAWGEGAPDHKNAARLCERSAFLTSSRATACRRQLYQPV